MSKESTEIIICQQGLVLHPDKALFWKEENTLILSDPHFSKTAHFRKNGIAVPASVDDNNYRIMDQLIDLFEPSRLLILGDLFHSDYNNEMQEFGKWRDRNSALEIELTLGNHDKLDPYFYSLLGISAHNYIKEGPFFFTHDPDDLKEDPEGYFMHGHIHPSVKIRGRGRQSVYLPCFLFREEYSILPSFGGFTGTHRIEHKTGDRVYAILEDQVLELAAK
ncbi:ligase-associated DNA damage response endonuclease PdeM [Balneola sp. MJW-20]|uniref:ligase-associated DNA damage response endonuclease PdeM n=1 Tax=Gracilimonas aurantiaca TaxID=3234185 RepID=UPI003466D6E1